MEFGLFEREEQILRQGRQDQETLAFGSEPARQAHLRLVDEYESSYREKRRLVRVSDRQQEQLNGLNEELQRSKEAAEQALVALQAAQESLIQAEKLASLGALVAGVAHEINTPVGTALASASYLARRTDEIAASLAEERLRRSDLTSYVEASGQAARLVLANCQRAAALIGSFKQVAVDQASGDQRRFALRPYLEEVVVSLGPRLAQNAHRLEIRGSDEIQVETTPGALSQILTNLILNSLVHGYEPAESGLLTIDIQLQPDGMVRLVYADDGKGIAAADLPRIFDPFFSTRRQGGGTGLGLHIVHNNVVGTLHGQISVDSAPGRGTQFTILFPSCLPGPVEAKS